MVVPNDIWLTNWQGDHRNQPYLTKSFPLYLPHRGKISVAKKHVYIFSILVETIPPPV
jgi:hypothetical protein